MNDIVQVTINVNTKVAQQQLIILQTQIRNTVTNMNNSMGTVSSSFSGFGKAIAGSILAVKALEMAGKGLFHIFEKSLEIKMETDTAINGIAGLITALYKVKDANGKLLEGPEAFARATEIARDQVNKLAVDSIRLGLSRQQLTEAFKIGLGPAAGAGLDVDKAREMAGLFSIVGKTMGMGTSQIARDFKDILIGRSNMLSTALGLGHGSALYEEYKTAIKTGQAYGFLKKQFEAFILAGQSQSEQLAGTLNALNDTFYLLGNQIGDGLAKQLNKARPILDSFFHKDKKDKADGTFNDEFIPAIATLNTIGTLIGTEIVGGIAKGVQLIKDFGAYITEDQSLITGISNGWEAVKIVIGAIIEVVKEIGTEIIKLIRFVVEGFNVGLIDSNDKLSDMQIAMKGLVGVASLIALRFALIKDVITGSVGALKILVGTGVIIDQKIRGAVNQTSAKVAGALDMRGTKKEYEGYAKENKIKENAGSDIAFQDNTLLADADQYGVGYATLKSTFEVINKSLELQDNISKSKSNPDFQKTIKEMMDNINKVRSGKGSGGSVDPRNPNKAHDKVRAMANAQYALDKAALEGEIALNKEKARELEAINDDRFKHNEITEKQYYDTKKEIINQDFNDQIRLLEMERKASLGRGIDNSAQGKQNKAEAMKIEQQILLVKAKQINAVKDLDREELNYLNTKRKQASLDEITNTRLDAEHDLSIKKINQDQMLALKKINATQSLQIDKQRIEDEYAIEYLALKDRMDLAKDDLDEQRQIAQEKLALDRKYAIDKTKMESDILLNSKKDAMEIQQTFEDSFATLIENIEGGKKSFLDSIKEFAKAINSELNKIAAKNISAGLFGDGGTSGGGGLLSGIGSFFAKAVGGGSSFSLPSFAVGTDYVPNDMVAQIHKGEKIVPAKYNNDDNGKNVHVNNHFHFSQMPDQRTQTQVAMQVGSEVQRATRRNG